MILLQLGFMKAMIMSLEASLNLITQNQIVMSCVFAVGLLFRHRCMALTDCLCLSVSLCICCR